VAAVPESGAREIYRAGNHGRSATVAATAGGGPARAAAPGTIAILRSTLIRPLLAATAVLGLASVAVQVSVHLLGHGRLLGLVTTFDMNREGNLPTWFSVALLLGTGAVLALIWAATRAQEDPDARYWAVLALVFAAASVDEAAELHETFGLAVTGGTHVYWYLMPGTLLLLGIALAMTRCFMRLPKSTRRALAWGVGTWTLGAVGLEGVEALYWPGDGVSHGFGLSLLNTFQDVFELLGLIVILDALMRYAGERGYRTTVELGRP
jgi:hypothetical protein